MSNRHYWPEPPKEGSERHLVEHENGEVLAWHLYSNGQWGEFDNARMERCGYLGVRTPFSEEAERAAFLSQMKFPADVLPVMVNALFQIWLEAVRHERGL